MNQFLSRIANILIVAIVQYQAAPVWAETSTFFSLEQIASGLNLPVAITHAGDGSGRIFITLQTGKIIIYDGIQIQPTPFLDISSLISCCDEQGLLSTAFHPNYKINGLFFVNYTDKDGNTIVARYHVSENPNLADVNSNELIIQVEQPFSNHNGGQLQFGSDGFLYIGMGDGGSGGDPDNRAQDPGDLLGKMLRIDIDGSLPYIIPADNPFIGDPDIRDEIWALGLRNPWRFSFDKLTSDVFIADVGQASIEEINFQSANSIGGANYGWRRMEGSMCFNPSTGCNNGTLILPILEYSHDEGCSIIGGYRYRGSASRPLAGVYVFGDFCSGIIWGGIRNGDNWTRVELQRTSLAISTFGEDEEGEIYVANLGNGSNGTVFRIVADTDAGRNPLVNEGAVILIINSIILDEE